MIKISIVPDQELNSNPAFENHKRVIKFEDQSVGLRGYIAIFNNQFGTALGGTRLYSYVSESEALTDVLKLSKAMAYKCAISNTPYDGGKAVIISDSKNNKTPNFLKSYAAVVSSLEGKFYTGEDVGLTEADVQYMLNYSPYFVGKTNQAGDPSPYASLSVFVIMKGAVKKVLKKNKLSGLSIGIKGLGKVGFGLINLLDKEGVSIVGADIDPVVIERVKREYPEVKIVDSEKILSEDIDIYAPCALGNEFTEENISKIKKIRIICGGANNQLANSNIADLLAARGITFIPDYLANSGGLINVADELGLGGYNRERVILRINKLKKIFNKLYKKSLKDSVSISFVAENLAKKKLKIIN